MKMRSTIRKASAIIACVAGISCVSVALAQQPIRIGYAADISGPCGMLVDGQSKGFKMGVEELNRSGGVLGRQIEIIERDTKTRPDEGAKEVRDLIVNHKVDVITGGCSSAVLLAESAISAELKVPMYSTIGITERLNIESWQPYFWMMPANTVMKGKTWAEIVARNKDWKRVSVIGYDYEMTHSTMKVFEPHLKALRPDIEISRLVAAKLGETNFSSQIIALLAQKPDVVVALIYGTGMANFLAQAKGYDFFAKSNLLTHGSVDFLEAMTANAPESGLYVLARAPFNALLDNPKAKAFIEAYKTRYNKVPNDWAVLGYEGVMFYAEALRQAKTTEPNAVMKAVTSLKFSGLRGNDLRVRALDGQVNAPLWYGRVGKDPDYPHVVMKNFIRINGDSLMMPEAEIKAQRAAGAKK